MKEEQAWQRRHAIHVVSQLPDDPEDALAVLRFAIEVVERFLVAPQEPLARPLSLVCARRSLSLSETGKPPSSPS